MRNFILGLIIGLLILPVAAYLYVRSGRVPVATSAPAMPFEKTITRMGLHAAIEQGAPKTVPLTADETVYLSGVQTYREHCAVCHGLPNQPLSAIAAGEFPKPPQLFKGKGVTDDPPQETYWLVTNGVRLTGMPGFEKTLSDEQRWQVSLLLANAQQLPASAQQALAQPETGTAAPAASTTVKK